MSKFDFYYDTKVTVWVRRSVTITAESEEEAIKFIQDHADSDVDYLENKHPDIVEIGGTETMYETEEPMTPEQNGGWSTVEWCNICPPHEVVAHNGYEL